MMRELMPNIMAPLLVAATLKVAAAVLPSYISYLGYGVQPPLASWGNMLTNAQGYFDTEPLACHTAGCYDHADCHELQLPGRRPARRARSQAQDAVVKLDIVRQPDNGEGGSDVGDKR